MPSSYPRVSRTRCFGPGELHLGPCCGSPAQTCTLDRRYYFRADRLLNPGHAQLSLGFEEDEDEDLGWGEQEDDALDEEAPGQSTLPDPPVASTARHAEPDDPRLPNSTAREPGAAGPTPQKSDGLSPYPPPQPAELESAQALVSVLRAELSGATQELEVLRRDREVERDAKREAVEASSAKSAELEAYRVERDSLKGQICKLEPLVESLRHDLEQAEAAKSRLAEQLAHLEVTRSQESQAGKAYQEKHETKQREATQELDELRRAASEQRADYELKLSQLKRDHARNLAQTQAENKMHQSQREKEAATALERQRSELEGRGQQFQGQIRQLQGQLEAAQADGDAEAARAAHAAEAAKNAEANTRDLRQRIEDLQTQVQALLIDRQTEAVRATRALEASEAAKTTSPTVEAPGSTVATEASAPTSAITSPLKEDDDDEEWDGCKFMKRTVN